MMTQKSLLWVSGGVTGGPDVALMLRPIVEVFPARGITRYR